MKKIGLYLLLLLLAAATGEAWLVLGSGTAFEEKTKSFIITENQTDKQSVLALMNNHYIIKNGFVFGLVADKLGMWDKLQPGKFEVRHGQSLYSIAKMLRKNRQAEIKLVINKIRTKQELAKLICKNSINDSLTVLAFLNNNDSLQQFGVDSNIVTTLIIPNTYSFYYNTPLHKIFVKLTEAHAKFWDRDRTQKATSIGFSPTQVTIIASIVEEETNKELDKGNIASVYMNRLAKGMALGADPTIKFALNDFSLKRILYVHLNVASPYNTYRNKGLPPGAICTPSASSIDAVLNAPKTDYLFFVAKANLDGYHHFSSNFAEHSQYAKQYQQALDAYLTRKQATLTEP